MKYRSSTEIIDTILRSLDSGATRTRIMYKAYLSYSQLKEYLSLLQDRQLLKYEEGSQIYTITEKGLRFMNAYDDIRELVSGTDEESFAKDSQTEKVDGNKKAELPTW
jgi:predicted transcriptional regulator